MRRGERHLKKLEAISRTNSWQRRLKHKDIGDSIQPELNVLMTPGLSTASETSTSPNWGDAYASSEASETRATQVAEAQAAVAASMVTTAASAVAAQEAATRALAEATAASLELKAARVQADEDRTQALAAVEAEHVESQRLLEEARTELDVLRREMKEREAAALQQGVAQAMAELEADATQAARDQTAMAMTEAAAAAAELNATRRALEAEKAMALLARDTEKEEAKRVSRVARVESAVT